MCILLGYTYSGVEVYGVLNSEHRAKLWKTKMNKKYKSNNYDYELIEVDKIYKNSIYQ